ncbi:MAG: hypothetical protein ISR69_09350 [Gammaproteobacteria bacterium]|nr:hypothetical protein [Gammaproteobacteria bacterium]
MSQSDFDKNNYAEADNSRFKGFANFWHGMFFFVSSVFLAVLLFMFIYVWQPIWEEGFKDFHTISSAIAQLDETAKPASNTIPQMLAEMRSMNASMTNMTLIMQEMEASIDGIEEMTPALKTMSLSIEHMTLVVSNELPRMAYLLGRVENKIPNIDFMPFK